jgi:hypothetical protein
MEIPACSLAGGAAIGVMVLVWSVVFAVDANLKAKLRAMRHRWDIAPTKTLVTPAEHSALGPALGIAAQATGDARRISYGPMLALAASIALVVVVARNVTIVPCAKHAQRDVAQANLPDGCACDAK